MIVKSFVTCEQIRQENSGNFILLGVFRTDVIENNLPEQIRWSQPCLLSALCGLSIDRKKDAGQYTIEAKAEQGETLSPSISLDVRSDGASFIQIPIVAHIKFNAPCDIIFSIFKKGETAPLLELGRMSIVETGKK
jgi:hypothetical protein